MPRKDKIRKMEILDYRKNQHYTFSRDGLDEYIQTHDQSRTVVREQPIRKRDSIQQVSRSYRKQ